MSFILLIIAILLTLLLVLAVPVTVAFEVDCLKEIKGQVRFYWLFGLVRFRIGFPSVPKAEPEQQRKPKKKKRKTGGRSRGVFALLKRSAFRQHAIRFVKDVLRAIHARDLYLRLRIGLDDPADTGRLWALVGPIAGIAINLRSAEVRIEPEFLAPMLEVKSHGEFRLIPLQFIALVTAFIVSPTTLHAWRTLRQSNA